MTVNKELAGIEDILIGQGTVEQARQGGVKTITKLNGDNIPYSGEGGGAVSMVAALDSHTGDSDNPHSTTKTHVGLGNVDNTSDVNKPVSTTQQGALDLKQNLADTTTNRNTNITVTVGSGGDYATINAALEYLTETYNPTYIKGGFTAEISLLTGFVMAEQVLVTGIDLGWITISGVDADTTIDRSALTTVFGLSAYYPVFGAYNQARLPIISQAFTMDTSGSGSSRVGVLVELSSEVTVLGAGSGIKNAGSHGMACTRNSHSYIPEADFSGADGFGLYALFNAVIFAYLADVSDCSNYAIYANGLSKIHADSAIASNCSASFGVYARIQSEIIFYNGIALNSGSTATIGASNQSKINANSTNCTAIGTNEYYVTQGSQMGIASATGGTDTNITVNTLTSSGIIFS